MAEEKPVPSEISAEEADVTPAGEQASAAQAAKGAKPASGSVRKPLPGERPAVVEIDVHDEEPGGPIVSRRDIKPGQS